MISGEGIALYFRRDDPLGVRQNTEGKQAENCYVLITYEEMS